MTVNPKVLLVKAKSNFNLLPEEQFIWLDQLARGLISQSGFYLKKNSSLESQDFLCFLPKNSPVQQIIIANTEKEIKLDALKASILPNAKGFFYGDFSAQEIKLLGSLTKSLDPWALDS